MLGLVYAEGFTNTIGVGGIGVVPAFFQFLEGNLVGRVAIDLVGAHVDERGVGSVQPGRFQQVQRADRR